VNLTARFEALDADDISSSSAQIDDDITYEEPTALLASSPASDPASVEPESLSLEKEDSQKTTNSRSSVSSVASTGSVSDVMIRNAKKVRKDLTNSRVRPRKYATSGPN